jgi:lipoprotein-anchoring transpeptidase ErfK/SrfK
MRSMVRPGGRHRRKAPGIRRAAVTLAASAMASVLATALLTAVAPHPRDGAAEGGPADDLVAARVGSTPEASRTEKVPTKAEDPLLSLVAEAKVAEVEIYDQPGAPEPARVLEHPTNVGTPLVFLVRERWGRWLKVLLPVRPNGRTGWVLVDQVTLFGHRYRIVVELREHRIRVFDGEDTILAASVAIGKRDTPTPGGVYYLKELLRPPDPNSVYGSYAYGLSGFSNVLESFNGGEGVIGIHGTNDPSVIGRDVSSGCIRMRNEDIEKLVPILPLGTPVRIVS